MSWIFLYCFFPIWRFVHLESLPLDNTRRLFITAIYLIISLFLINRFFNSFTIEKPLVIRVTNWFEHIKNNAGLVIVCFLSLLLHIKPLSLDMIVTGGGEIPYVWSITWIYDFINKYWHRLFDFPIEYLYWLLIVVSILLVKQKNMINSIRNYFKDHKLSRYGLIAFIIMFFFTYSYYFPNFDQHKYEMVRYPPVSRYLYLISFFTFGISYIIPRILQFILYILGAVYIYRSIYLFYKKETALLGATIFLFSPLIFFQASLGMLASGSVFFLILISFYFLRFLKDEDNRDLILSTYFIGLGFLYERLLMLMLIICITFFLLKKIKAKDWGSIGQFKVLLLSLIPILPMLKIVAVSPQHAPMLSNLLILERLTIYAVMIQSQISWIVFFLFLISYVAILFDEKNDLLLFYAYIFIVYYCFFTSMGEAGQCDRYALVFYPAISVFIAQFISRLSRIIRWKYTFKILFSALSIYLAVLCVIPRSSSSLTTYRYENFEAQHYPIKKSTDWIRDKTGMNEKVLPLFLNAYKRYLEKFYAGGNIIIQQKIAGAGIYMKKVYDSQDPIEALKEQCLRENIKYVMFAYGPNNAFFPNEKFTTVRKKKKFIYENISKKFIKVAEFNIDDNYIFIYKIRETL